jgi:hypothetical protein
MSNINKTYIFETVLITGGTSGTTVEFITGATFNPSTGNLGLETVSGNTINVPMDGRYSLTGHTHDEYSLTGHTHVVADITDFTDNSTQWDSAYDDTITGVTITGTTTKTITLEQRDGGSLSANFTDDSNDASDVVTGMTFNIGTGLLTLTTLSGDTITENLDGRYLNLSGSTGDDYTTGSTFNIGTGILEFTRVSGGTYNVDLDGRYALTGHTHNLSDLNNDIGFITGATSTANDYLTGGTFNTVTGELDLVLQSGSTVTIDLDGRYAFLSGGTSFSDDYVSGATFSATTGDLNLNLQSGSTVTVNLDGRYFLSGPITFSSETSGSTTYVGYGEVNACKIRKIVTTSGSTYTAFWSNGVETLDKIWVNRYSYSYF